MSDWKTFINIKTGQKNKLSNDFCFSSLTIIGEELQVFEVLIKSGKKEEI